MRFLCDEMVANLGRWLRAAGYDTELAERGTDDRLLFDRAFKEDRILLTRDRHFLNKEFLEKHVVIYLKGEHLEDWVQELESVLQVHWLHHPFSRCIICNTPFEDPNDTILMEKVPPHVRMSVQQFWFCPTCEKIYWEGSHTEHMRAQLEAWEEKRKAS